MPAAASFVVALTGAAWGLPGVMLLPVAVAWLFIRDRTMHFAVCGAILAGACIGHLWLQQALQSRVPVEATDKVVDTVGVVETLPRRVPGFPGQPDGWRFDLRLVEPLATLPDVRRLRVSWYPQRERQPCTGERLMVTLELRAPRGLVNPHGPDSERVLLGQGIDGYARLLALHGQVPQEGVLADAGPGSCGGVRQKLSRQVHAALEGGVGAALVPALVVGDRRYLDEQHWQVLQRTGTAHLVAISGLHISLVAWLVWWLMRALLALPMAFSGGHYDAGVLALVPAAVAALGYAWLAGFSAPTLRALVMALLVFGLLAAGWRMSAGRILLMALAVLLGLQPGLALMQGFWLSVLAVTLLTLLAGLPRPLLQGHALMTMGVGLVAGSWFSHWSVSALLANLLLVPLFALLVIPLSLLGSLVPGAGLLLEGSAWILEIAWEGMGAASRLPGLPLPRSSWLLLALLVAVVVLLRPGLPGTRWSLPVLLLLLLPALQQRLPHGQFEVLTFDVGQGQAVAVKTRNMLMLYDTGPDPGLAGRHLMPWLLRQPQREKFLVASHGDSDHAGGVARVAEVMDFHWRLSGQPERLPGFDACRRGQTWRRDGVTFEVLWPQPGITVDTANDSSCVVRVSTDTFSALLTGDIEKPVEYWLLAHGLAPVDLVTVPHHGSASSSSFAFIRRLAPETALVSAGWQNRFSHPSQKVIHRWQSFQAGIGNTASAGAIRAGSSGRLLRWRLERLYPWRQGVPVVE